MRWRGRRESSNVRISGGKVAGGGVLGIIIGLVLWLVFDMNPMTALQTGQSVAGGRSVATQSVDENSRDVKFVKVVLADTEVVWDQIFKELGLHYEPPQLIIFNGTVNSACGSATAATGPFYCPADRQVYLDTSFFVDMRKSIGVTGDINASSDDTDNQGKAGDFAQAYVIAHEVGHHVQTLLGTSQEINKARRVVTKVQANALSVRQELQADCYAGVWANRNQQRVNFLEEGDIEEAIQAASQIGDDRLAHASGHAAVPDNFTHGTSQQRVHWFTKGLKSGDIYSCDTFKEPI